MAIEVIIESYVYTKKFFKPIIDKVLAHHYGFAEEELDFIINYDIKYRMGDDLNEEELCEIWNLLIKKYLFLTLGIVKNTKNGC
uniref:DUF3791 domain-containing protein n=1 Tax=Prevotella sp. GTC17254 TaxID=3236794 RepID=A0AB33J409_9BACT